MMADLQALVLNSLLGLEKLFESSGYIGEAILWIFQLTLLGLGTGLFLEITL